jgi:ring-1,2-phenylacetyl-CoA epoxidase subunit PaaC
MTTQQALFEYCLRLGDTSLVLGQRLAEWCGHGPALEEDIALTNISLDLIGQTRAFYTHACTIENKGRTEDDLAFLRSERDFRNVLLAEQPNGDFAQTLLRQFLLSSFQVLQYSGLSNSKDETLSALAQKSLKEVTYHRRHSADWVVRLGQGTDESRRRMLSAIEELWMYVDDLFDSDETDQTLLKAGIAIDMAPMRKEWNMTVGEVFKEAGLSVPEKHYSVRGSREGRHTEHLGHLLAEMQSLHRAHPGAEW